MEETLLFEIEDTGRGISKEEMSKLFNAFEQVGTKDNRAFIGTGLGLNISKTYVEMMGGRIMVESELGQGTTFTVEIPIVKGSAEEESEKKEDDLNEQMLSAPNAYVLLVDDNEFNIKTVEALLSLFNVNARSVYSGREAIDIVQKEDFDIIFMDHMMPEMDGIEATNEIRKLGGKCADCIIIALTANAIYGAKEMFLANGFNGYISKPIEMRSLKRLLQDWLPKEKVKLKDMPSGKKKQNFDPEFLKTLHKLFYKNNCDKYTEITAALDDGNITTAHRLAHTLKSNAGQLGITALQSAAEDIERSLKHGKNNVTGMQLKILDKELHKVLEKFSGFHQMPENQAEAQKTVNPAAAAQDAAQNIEYLDAKSAAELLEALIPLLKSGNTECIAYIEKIRLLKVDEGLKKQLIQQIDDFKFENAYNSILQLKEIMLK